MGVCAQVTELQLHATDESPNPAFPKGASPPAALLTPEQPFLLPWCQQRCPCELSLKSGAAHRAGPAENEELVAAWNQRREAGGSSSRCAVRGSQRLPTQHPTVLEHKISSNVLS